MAKYDDTDWTALQRAEARQRDREIAAEQARQREQAERDAARKDGGR